MIRRALVAAATLVMMSVAALSADILGKTGAWELGVVRNQAGEPAICTVTTYFNSGAIFRIGSNRESAILMVFSPSKKFAADVTSIKVQFDDSVPVSFKANSLGPDYNILFASVDPDFMASYANSNKMTIRDDKSKIGYDVTLDGSNAAVAFLSECVLNLPR